VVAARKTAVDVETKRAPSVVAGTLSATEAEAFADAVAASEVDPRVWTGAFATNVWGGRFAVDGVLGQGSQGTTFSGTDLKTGARVAVKVFDVGRAKDWKSAELFEREVATLKQLDHPGVPRFLDVIIDDETGARALVRTLVPGDSLANVVKRDGPLAEAALWHVLVDAADVLGALHSRAAPIVHRDLKPSNLIQRPDGKVCLVDFGGVGRTRDAAGSTVVGTFGYMAPEQLYGAQTPATDMYSLGASLLALATAKEPEDLPRDGLAIDVDKAAPTLSQQMRTLLKDLVAPDPKNRPADARALLARLKEIAAQKDVGSAHQGVALPDLGRSLNHSFGDGSEMFVGIVQLVFSVLGVAGAVVVGQILLPLVITLMAAFSSSPERRAKLEHARNRVREAARVARGTFERSALEGAKSVELASERDKVRRKAWKRAYKEQRRAWREARKEEARRRREERFWR
jgi:hypothetical protein